MKEVERRVRQMKDNEEKKESMKKNACRRNIENYFEKE